MADDIPLIDLAPLADGLDGARTLAPTLNRALEEVGFLIITNHGVERDLIAQTFAETKRFHHQPMDAKRALLMNEHNNGYMAQGRYNVRTSRVSERTVKPGCERSVFQQTRKNARRPAGPRQPPVRWTEPLACRPARLPGNRD